jgi:excisionase family DNA binding protein
MKKGNVIATGVKAGAVKGSAVKGGAGKAAPLKSGAEKVLPSGSKVGIKAETSAKKGAGAKGKADAKLDPEKLKFLSVRQVALRWGSSQGTVRRLIEEGKLNGIRLRHACRLSIESVVKYEASTHF